MMNKKYLLFILFIILTSAICQNQMDVAQSNYVKFKADTLIPYANLKLVKSVDFKINDLTEQEYYTYLEKNRLFFCQNNKIFIYNIENQIISMVEIKTLSQIKAVNYLNDDSLLLLLYGLGRYDTTLVLSDINGNIKKIYNLDSLPVPTVRNNVVEDTASYILPDKPVCLNNKIYLKLLRRTSFLGDFRYKGKSILASIDMKTNHASLLPIDFPFISYDSAFYTYNMSYFDLITRNDTLFFNFPYLTEIFYYDFENRKLRIKEIETFFVDSLYPEKDINKIPADYSTFMLTFANFSDVYFYRFLLFPFKYGMANMILEVYDKNFNPLYVTYKPKKSKLLTIYKDTLLFLRKNQENNFLLNYYIINKIEKRGNINFLKQKILKEKKVYRDTVKVLKKLVKTNNKNFTVTILWYDATCPSISDFILRHFKMNSQNYAKHNNFLLIISDENKEQIQKVIKEYNISNKIIKIYPNPKIIQSGIINFYNLPEVIQIRNNKVVIDTVFGKTPEEIENTWQDFLIKSAKDQK